MAASSGSATIFKPTESLPVLEADPLNIGVIWSSAQGASNTPIPSDTLRAFFSQLAAEHPECRLYSLESAAEAPPSVRELAAHFSSPADLTPWLHKLDLVISPAHAVADLARHLQRPLWLLGSDTASAESLPAYADFHVFAPSGQAEPSADDWASVFQTIKTALFQIYGR